MTSHKRMLFASVAGILASGFAGAASAQVGDAFAQGGNTTAQSNFSRDRAVAVLARPKAGYEAVGLPLGAFTAYPKLGVTAGRTDNVYASSARKVDDTTWQVKPEVVVVSKWSRHSVQVFASGNITRFSDRDAENSDDFTIGASGRLDISARSNATAGIKQSSLTEPRTSSSSPLLSANPIEFDQTQRSPVPPIRSGGAG